MGVNFWLTLIKISDRSFNVKFLFELTFLFEKTSKLPRLAGIRIAKVAIQIKPPPNQAISARQRCRGFDKKSTSKTGKPVVVKALTISKQTSVKLTFVKIIQFGIAKNRGKNKNRRTKDIICVVPVSFKFLFEVAKYTKAKIKKPVRLV